MPPLQMIFQDQNAHAKSKDLISKCGQIEENRHDCNICGKSYKHSHHLRRHLVSHSGEKPYACSICGKSFGRKDTCQDHIRSIHNFGP